MLRRLKTLLPLPTGRPDKSPRRPDAGRRTNSGRSDLSGRREKPLPPAAGGSPWSTYLTETVRYHHCGPRP